MEIKKKELKKNKIYYEPLTEKTLNKAVELDYPVLMEGDTGVGKSSYIRELANERGIDLVRLNLTGQTGVDEIVGKWIVKGGEMVWIDGPLITAMKVGQFIVFDEINMALPEILSVLHSLLDDDKFITLKEHNNEIVRPHERFRFFATMNPTGDYVGTKELNRAFKSRFPLILNIQYSPNEVDIIVDRTGISEDDASKLVMAAKEVRQNKAKGNEIDYTCSTRDLIYCAELLQAGFEFKEAIQLSILNKIDTQGEKDIVRKMFELVTGKSISFKLTGKEVEVKSYSEITKLLDKKNDGVEKYQNRIKELEEMYKDLQRRATESEKSSKEKIDVISNKYIKTKNDLIVLQSAKSGMLELLKKAKTPPDIINKLLGDGTVPDGKPVKLKKIGGTEPLPF